jgi:hypothetical protein
LSDMPPPKFNKVNMWIASSNWTGWSWFHTEVQTGSK